MEHDAFHMPLAGPSDPAIEGLGSFIDLSHISVIE